MGRVVFEKAIGREPTEEEAEALMRRRLDHLPEEVESSPGFVVKDGVRRAARAPDPGRDHARPHHRKRRGGRAHQARPPQSQSLLRLRRIRLRFTGSHGAHQDGARAGRASSRGTPSTGTGPSACGDTPRDVDAGHGAGIRVVGVATGEYTAEELVEAGADAAIRFARRRPSAPLGGRRSASPPGWLIRHIRVSRRSTARPGPSRGRTRSAGRAATRCRRGHGNRRRRRRSVHRAPP